FPLFHQAINQKQQPFMGVLFTVSSHSPYDQPRVVAEVEIEDEERPFLNSAKYTDHCLGEFMEAVRKEPWYANTLFVIVGDHGHPTHLKKSAVEPAYLQVPLLLYGEVVAPELRGTRNPKVGSHVDLAATLLRQLGLEASAFGWSKDLLNPYAPAFAYFETYSGYGWVRPQGAFTEVKSGRQWHVSGYGDSTLFPLLQQEGRAYLQTLYQRYCKY
ncbi:MAG: sulfatase-like hydrolase/transferase, partial [Deltaproteobacteria bacterium]|nr:sulfatase-like hydrolase/transferase [Deltaproteobacteria bacterium]